MASTFPDNIWYHWKIQNQILLRVTSQLVNTLGFVSQNKIAQAEQICKQVLKMHKISWGMTPPSPYNPFQSKSNPKVTPKGVGLQKWFKSYFKVAMSLENDLFLHRNKSVHWTPWDQRERFRKVQDLSNELSHQGVRIQMRSKTPYYSKMAINLALFNY